MISELGISFSKTTQSTLNDAMQMTHYLNYHDIMVALLFYINNDETNLCLSEKLIIVQGRNEKVLNNVKRDELACLQMSPWEQVLFSLSCYRQFLHQWLQELSRAPRFIPTVCGNLYTWPRKVGWFHYVYGQSALSWCTVKRSSQLYNCVYTQGAVQSRKSAFMLKTI